MQLASIFLFISFIHLCNSLSFIIKKHSPSFMSRHKLNMGCDYYVDKDLHVYDNNNDIIAYINVNHEPRYYWFVSSLDEDEDGYDGEFAQYRENTLEPSMKPIVIYSNNTFNKVSFENKYKTIIENELKSLKKTWSHVNKILKIENRYER